MANEEQVKILKQGGEVWNKWRSTHSTSRIDLVESDLEGADLSRAELWEASLKNANLRGAKLSGTDLRNSDLSDACLNGADLSGADLNSAVLYNTDFGGAKVGKTDFSRASLTNTLFTNIDLSNSIGLEKAIHWRASVIDTKTIQLSKGKIPLAFLRGCGLSDLDIEYTKLAVPGLEPSQVTDITESTSSILAVVFSIIHASSAIPAKMKGLPGRYTKTCKTIMSVAGLHLKT